MKKQFIYTICAVLLLAIAVIGSTYAFFSATTGENSNVTAEASKFEVLYTGGTDIGGPVTMSSDRTGGKNTTVHIRVGEGSAQALAYLYLNIDSITTNLRVSGFKWEVSGMRGGQEVYTNSGNFAGYNDTTNNVITIVEDYRLTEQQTDFTIYLWVDGNEAGNEVMDGRLGGYISASTERFTGQLSNIP